MKVSYDFLCLDERDSPNLSELRNHSRRLVKNAFPRRHFGICGVVIPGATYPELNMAGRSIQEKILGKGKYMPFHYVEILNNYKKYSFLNKDSSKKDSIRALLNNLVKETNFKIIASFIDKHQLALDYGIFEQDKLSKIRKIKPNISRQDTPRKINLYETSLKFILQNYYKYLKDRKRRGLIIAEARGKTEDLKLLDAFYGYQKSGAGNLSGRELRSYITDLLIIHKSQNHLGTQLSDLITYPFYDYFVPHHNPRKDHFIKKESFEGKIYNWEIFPKQKRS